MSSPENITGVQLGRFCPYHLGHAKITDAIIERHGAENTTVIVGTANRITQRTPFSFDLRKRIIETLYPDIEILPLNDYKPKPGQKWEDTIPSWFERIKRVLAHKETGYKFYGGSPQDLEILGREFDTEVIVDRIREGKEITATKIREAMARGELDLLAELVDERIIPILIATT
jgi:nicotinamide mononucleotide adenylyltransferase